MGDAGFPGATYPNNQDFWELFIPLLEALDVVIVCSSGNGGFQFDDPITAASDSMNTDVPRYHARNSAYSLIVIGASTSTRGRYTQSNYGFPTTAYAPGLDVICASWETDTDYIQLSGTSPATAMTAGLIANWLTDPATAPGLHPSPGNTARAVKNFIQTVATYHTTSLGGTIPIPYKIVGTYDYVPCTPAGSKRSDTSINQREEVKTRLAKRQIVRVGPRQFTSAALRRDGTLTANIGTTFGVSSFLRAACLSMLTVQISRRNVVLHPQGSFGK